MPEPEFTRSDHIPLTTHTDAFGVDPVPILWSHPNPSARGPVICTVRHSAQKNVIGAHQRSYCIYTGLAVAAGEIESRLRLESKIDISSIQDWTSSIVVRSPKI